jgi:biopolymer transport protein ExbD
LISETILSYLPNELAYFLFGDRFTHAEPILLQLTSSGEVILHGDMFMMEQMPRMMKKERTILLSLGKSPADATMIVRAHEDCAAGKIQELIGICQANGFDRFVLRAKQEQRFWMTAT